MGFFHFSPSLKKSQFTIYFDFLQYYKERQLSNQTLSKYVNQRLKCNVRNQTEDERTKRFEL